jgi:hypothetical protein
VERHPDTAAEAVNTDQGHERAQEFNVLLGRQTGVHGLLEPLARQPSRVCDDPMDHLHSGVGERPKMVVLANDRCRSEGGLTGLTECAVPGVPHFGGNGDTLRACLPRPGRRQTFPEAAMGGRKVIADGHEGSTV